MPAAAAILLGLLVLGVLVVLLLTLWRLVGNLRDLARALVRMSDQLGPALGTLQQQELQAARRAGAVEADADRISSDWNRLEHAVGRRRWAHRRGPAKGQTDPRPRA